MGGDARTRVTVLRGLRTTKPSLLHLIVANFISLTIPAETPTSNTGAQGHHRALA
jgi:hypothetical protein